MALVEDIPTRFERASVPMLKRALRFDVGAVSRPLRFFVDILHPTDAHFFHHFIVEMRRRGHEFLVASREKECAVDLLDRFDIPHVVASRQARGAPGLVAEFARRFAFTAKAAQHFDPDYLLGLWGPVIAPASRLMRGRSVVFYDNEDPRKVNAAVYRTCDVFCSPRCYRDDAGSHHVRYPGYQQLAYLHPERFRPEPERLAPYGLGGDERLFLVRFVSWESAHDIGQRGFSPAGKRELVEILSRHGRVVISSEGALPPDLERFRLRTPVDAIFDVLSAADMIVGESSSMSAEAAVLGTHAVFVSSTRRGFCDDIEARYGLVHTFTQREEREALARVDALLELPDLKTDAMARRQRLLAEHEDITDWLVDFFENGGVEAAGAAARRAPTPVGHWVTAPLAQPLRRSASPHG